MSEELTDAVDETTVLEEDDTVDERSPTFAVVATMYDDGSADVILRDPNDVARMNPHLMWGLMAIINKHLGEQSSPVFFPMLERIEQKLSDLEKQIKPVEKQSGITLKH